MSANGHNGAREGADNHPVRSWLRSLLRRPSYPAAELVPTVPSNGSAAISHDASTSSGADMISFHHVMGDVDRPTFSPPPRSFSGGSSNASLSYEAAARRTLAEPIATPKVGPSHASQSLSPGHIQSTPPDHDASTSKSPRLSRTLSNGVASLSERLHHQRRASETFRRMRSGSIAVDAESQLTPLSDKVSKTLDPAGPLVSSPPSLSEQEGDATYLSNAPCKDESHGKGPTDAARTSTSTAPDHAVPQDYEGKRSAWNTSATPSSSSLAPPHSPTLERLSSTSSFQSRTAGELLLPEGEQMLKVTHKKVKPRIFKLDPDRGQIMWESKKDNRVNLESIREVRFGPSAASYRTSLNISSAHEPRWLSIIYQNGGIYKALHLIALTDASLARWRNSLLHLQSLRRELLGAVGASSSIEHRRHLWMRHHWKDADQSNDEKLSIEEVMKLCRRLGIESNKAHLRQCFNLADWRNRGYLDFHDFQQFVSLLKQRADVQSIFVAWADQPLDQEQASEKSEVLLQTEMMKVSTTLERQSNSSDAAGLDPVSSPITATAGVTRTAGPDPGRTRAISIDSFRRFVREEQGNHDFTDGQIDDLFRRHCNSRLSTSHLAGVAIERAQMDYDGFLDFLSSSDNPPLLDQLPLFSTMVSDPVEMPVLGNSASSAPSDSRQPPKSHSDREFTQSQPQPTPSRAFADTTEELIAAGANNSTANTKKVAAHLRKSTIKHDMTRPLSEYYISSSHNTYLVGGQWKGDSTVEGYIRALLQGARSVELDCWDGPNNVPQITHGRTLTSRVPFQDVISAIARYAFVTSPYPLILSLEVHADPPQQETMARILRDTLGEMLLTRPIGSRSMPTADEDLPSPEELKFKVLVKAKNVSVADHQRELHTQQSGDLGSPPHQDGSGIVTAALLEHSSSTTDATSDATTTTDSEIEPRLSSAKQLVRRVTRRGHRSDGVPSGTQRDRGRDAVDDFDPQKDTRRDSGRSSKQAKKKMSTELTSLLIYTIGVKLRGFNKKEFYATQHMISLSEKTALKLIRDPISNEALTKHNRTHLTRVYPSMMSFARLHSSRNFVPLDMWATGCQLVALNWQTTDLGFELNQAMFSRNGRCGYVLKPAALRSKEHGKTLAGKSVRFSLDLCIVSAQQLPKKARAGSSKDRDKGSSQDSREPIDPFVVVSMLAPGSWGKQPKGLLQTTTVSEKSIASDLVDNQHLTQSRVAAVAVARVRAEKSGSAGVDACTAQRSADLQAPTPSIEEAPQKSHGANKPAAPPREASSESSRSRKAGFVPSHLLRTPTVQGNGFSPEWRTCMSVLIDVPASASNDLFALVGASKSSSSGDLLGQKELDRLSRGSLDLCFVRFEIFDDDLECEGTASASSTTAIDAHNVTSLASASLSPTPLSESGSKVSLDSSSTATTPNASGTGNRNTTSDAKDYSIKAGATNELSSASSAASIDAESVAAYSVSVGALQQGYRHLPLYNHQLSQFLFSTLFIHSRLRLVGIVDAGTSNRES